MMHINVIKMLKCSKKKKNVCLRINETPASFHPVIGQMPRALLISEKKKEEERKKKTC